MPRVKRGVTARASHKKILDLAKGFRGRRKNVYRIAKEAVMKAGQYAYRDRRNKKSEFRALWLTRMKEGRGRGALPRQGRLPHGAAQGAGQALGRGAAAGGRGHQRRQDAGRSAGAIA